MNKKVFLTESSRERTVTMQEGTMILHQCFGFSHGDNFALKYGEAIYRNKHGRLILPADFTNEDKAPKAIATYAGNPQVHPARIPGSFLSVAIEEARFFKKVMESSDKVNAYHVWRMAGRPDLSKPILSDPEHEIVCHMLFKDEVKLKRHAPPIFMPLLTGERTIEKMPIASEILREVNLLKTISLLRKIVDDDSASDDDRNKASRYLDMYRRLTSGR